MSSSKQARKKVKQKINKKFNKIIVVTGTPGSGKTTIATAIARRANAVYIDVNQVIKKEKLTASFDKKRNVKIVDTEKLNKVLIEIVKEARKKQTPLIIDSHLSHYLPKKYVDLCIVTKTSLKKLKKRLQKRNYSKAKIRENMDCEIFDVCLMEAKEAGHTIKVVET